MVTGPRRLRFTIGVPARLRALALRYHTHQFGTVKLTGGPALPSGRGRA